MKILVVGTVPPPGGDGARHLAAIIGELVAEGHAVEVLSPDGRSAAHRHAQLNGVLLAIQLLLMARRYEALVLRIEPDLPLSAESGRLARTIVLGACGAALRLWRHVTIRLDSPVPIPGGIGGRATQALWSQADRIVVGSEEDRTALLRAKGVDADRVSVEEAPVALSSSEPAGWVLDDEPALREEVLSLVRSRAARERQINSARIALGSTGIGSDASSVFSSSERPSPSVVGLARLVYSRGRRELNAMRSRSVK